jgi:hypothetical protein
VVFNFLGSDVIAAVYFLHCRHRCRNNVALDLSGLLLLLQRPLFFAKHLLGVGNYIVVLVASELLVLIEVVVVALIGVKLDEPLIGVVYLVSLYPYFIKSCADRALSTCRAPLAYRGSACTSTFLVPTNWLRNPFAEALSRVSSLAMAAACSAASIAFAGVLFPCGCRGALGCRGSHFSLALWFERSCTLSSLCTCRLRHYD